MSAKGVDQGVFWSHVDKSAEHDGCWIWTGSTSKPTPTAAVYGKYTTRGVSHRVAYQLLIGPIPDGLELDHLCGVTLCCNPQHLEPVTRAENMKRRAAKQTHCKHGHEFNEENTYWRNGHRSCRACNNRITLARYHARKNAEREGRAA